MASTMTTSLQTQDSPLLNRPSELRNAIYQIVLQEPRPVQIFYHRDWREESLFWNTTDGSKPIEDLFWHPPAALQACRQVRQEASAIYYANNAFKSTTEDQFEELITSWLRITGNENLKVLKHLCIHHQPNVVRKVINSWRKLYDFYDEINGAGLALGKDVLKARTPVYLQHLPTPNELFPDEVDKFEKSLAQVERGRIVLNIVLEDDSGAIKKELQRPRRFDSMYAAA